MNETFQAICLVDIYSYRAGERIDQPSFIAGNKYTFIESHFITQADGLGNVAAVNERGLQSIMPRKYIQKGFQILDA